MARKRQRGNGRGTLFQRSEGGFWVAKWHDHDGKRHEESTKTTDKGAAELVLSKHITDVALRRNGVIDARQDRFATESRKPLADHVADYIEHCRRTEQSPHHVNQKQRHLQRFLDGSDVARLPELTADALHWHLCRLRDDGRSARTWNFVRQIVVAFASWLVKNGRAESNPLVTVARLDESRDRRRVRRPLTDDEMAASWPWPNLAAGKLGI